MIKTFPFIPHKKSQEQKALEHVFYPENSQMVVNTSIRVGENAQFFFSIIKDSISSISEDKRL